MQKKSVRQMFRKYPDVVTIPQVCEMLGVSRNYAYLLVKQGKLTRLDLGRIVRVTKSSVIELKEKVYKIGEFPSVKRRKRKSGLIVLHYIWLRAIIE